MKVLHITPHLGGGAGGVILNWICNDPLNEHTIVCLGYLTDNSSKICYENKITVYEDFSKKDYSLILQLITYVDIVVIHYWNFPLLLHFLVNNTLPECRLITWFHNSGFYAPYDLPENIIQISDKFVFTSPISFNTIPIIKRLVYEDKLSTIWSTSGIDKYKNIQKKEHKGFNILYAGTLDFSKLDSNYIYICSQILKEIPEATITIIGTGCSEQEMKFQVEHLGLQDKIKFEGFISDLIPYFEIADIFLYLLDNKHYGTGEQILGEIQASGIPAIVFNNPCEKEIILQGHNGVLVSNIEECVKEVLNFYNNKQYREETGVNAKIVAEKKYSTKKMIDDWNALLLQVIEFGKEEKCWEENKKYFNSDGFTCFLNSLTNQHATIFKKYIEALSNIENLFQSSLQWQSESKGSIKQYLQYFPNDIWLEKFQKIIDETGFNK